MLILNCHLLEGQIIQVFRGFQFEQITTQVLLVYTTFVHCQFFYSPTVYNLVLSIQTIQFLLVLTPI